MIVSVGSLEIGEHTGYRLKNLENAERMAYETQRSDQGVQQILVTPLSGGVELELYGWFTREQEDSLMEMAAACEEVDLIHPKYSGKVLVTGSGLEDVIEYADTDSSDRRTGPIYLITV